MSDQFQYMSQDKGPVRLEQIAELTKPLGGPSTLMDGEHKGSRLSRSLHVTFRRDVDLEQKWVMVILSIADEQGQGYAYGWISAKGNLCLTLSRAVLRRLKRTLFKLGRVFVIKDLCY